MGRPGTWCDEWVTLAVGVLLAAGAGRRMGGPKALLRDPDGTSWLHRSLTVLRDGGCPRLVVVLGAAHEQAAALLAGAPDTAGLDDVEVVVAGDWDEGMGASLRAGLRHLGQRDPDGVDDRDGGSRGAPAPDAALVSLVDLPDVGPDVVRRLLDAVDARGAGRATLARAAYDGVPGHPVVLGADHWAGVVDVARGDRGARDHLAGRPVDLVECGDLATGSDRDTPVRATRLTEGAPRG